MLPLVPVVKILKKKLGKFHRENLGESGGQTFKGSDREKCRFYYFGNFQHQAFASFWCKGSINETSPIGEKKIHNHRRKTRENDNFLTKQSPFLSPNFTRGSTVIVIPHNVELCKQYFLQDCLLLNRKSCN